MGILKHIINEVINEDELKKEIELYKNNSKVIEDLQASIEDTLKTIKAKNSEENQRLKFIIKYMEDFKVSKVEGDSWVASLEEVAMYKYPSIGYKEVYEAALSKLNDATKKVLKQVESEHLAGKRQMKKKELVIKENLIDKGVNWLLNKWKGLLLSMKSYKSVVKALPSIEVNEGGYKRRRDNRRHNDKLRNAPSPEQNQTFSDIVKKSKEWEEAHKKDKSNDA
jgi:hypothetical protein